jgi:ADP-heptose:LPS heptosyltransferase
MPSTSLLTPVRIGFTLLASAIVNRLLFNHRPLDATATTKILVIQTRDIGDVVLATVVLEPLRERFPNAQLVLVIGEWAQELVEGSPLIDGTVSYCSALASNADPRQHTWRGRLRSIRRIIAERPDVIVELRGDLGTLVAAVLSRARHRADRGTWRLSHIAHNLLSRRKFRLSRNIHEVEVSLQIAASLGASTHNRRLSLFATEDEVYAVEQLLKADHAHGRRFIAIHPGASRDEKRWPAEHFAALADHIGYEMGDVRFVITGSKKEQHLAETIAASMSHPLLDLCGRLTLGQLHALYKSCALWIGNDTGPMHIAAATGIPVIAVWGPVSTPKYYPFTTRRLMITKALNANAVGSTLRDDIASITVEQAWRQLQRFLDEERVWLAPVDLA